MPELPEVETVRRYLDQTLKNTAIARAEVFRFNLRIGTSIPKDFAAKVAGTTIKAVKRRGKYILVYLSSGDVITVHLGMTGRFIVYDSVHAKEKHDHVILSFTDGRCLVFSDPRRFGMVDLADEKTALNRFKNMGFEPLSDRFNPDSLLLSLKGRKTAIKLALLDQSIIAGLGNIYVCEALFQAGISPLLPAANLTLKQSKILIPIIKDILQESIKAGGTTFRDYRSAEGKKGRFVSQLFVYGKAGENCVKCGRQIIKIVQGGRGTFYCPKCQKQVKT